MAKRPPNDSPNGLCGNAIRILSGSSKCFAAEMRSGAKVLTVEEKSKVGRVGDFTTRSIRMRGNIGDGNVEIKQIARYVDRNFR